MTFPINFVIFGFIILLIILIIGAEMSTSNNNKPDKCTKSDSNSCTYPNCSCYGH